MTASTVIVVAGSSGSGKTTWISQALKEHNLCLPFAQDRNACGFRQHRLLPPLGAGAAGKPDAVVVGVA